MILAIDMGNTHIEFGLMDGNELVMSERIGTDPGKTATEYAVQLHTIFEIMKIDVARIEGAIISSVVPQLTFELKKAVKKAVGITPLVVGPGVKTGLKIQIDDPKTLGADMVVGAVGGANIYGTPLILIDMGTATTISSIDESGTFRGGVIIPGVNVSLNALVERTSQLPKIPLAAPPSAIGTNTAACMQSGIVYGQASMLDGMISRFREEMKGTPVTVATGGLAKVIVPYCREKIILDNELMIKGLKIIYDKARDGGK